MEFIFKKWKDKLAEFESKMEGSLDEVRKCKAEIQQMKQETEFERPLGRYIRDDQRIILSAPEIIIGNVDPSGVHLEGAGSTVIVRGSEVGVEGVGESGKVTLRAPSICQIAEDPGCDGQEHVVGSMSEVVSQARQIIIHSQAEQGVFSEVPAKLAATGVRIHADESIEIDAAKPGTKFKKHLVDDLIKEVNNKKKEYQEQAAVHKNSLDLLVTLMERLLEDKAKLDDKDKEVRATYKDMEDISIQIEQLSMSLSEEVCGYAKVLSGLAETNRRLKCLKDQEEKIKEEDDYKKTTTGSSLRMTGESISLVSKDADGNLRDNKESGVSVLANEMNLCAIEDDHSLKKEGKIALRAMKVDVSTSDSKDRTEDDNKLNAKYPTDGSFTLTSKNILFGAIDREVKDSVEKDKELAKDGKITLWAQNIDVNTAKIQNVDVDKDGKVTKAEYPADGEIVINSKTITVGSVDSEFDSNEPHQRKEKALTEGSRLQLRSERMAMNASTTDRKATGAIVLNAKEVGLKAIDTVDKKQSLAEGGKVKTVAEGIYLGEYKDEKLMSHKVQAWSERITILGSKLVQAIQGKKKATDAAFLKLSESKASLKGQSTELHGPTKVVGDIETPKVNAGDLKVKGEFKSPNISDGITAGPAPKSTLKPEDDYE